MTTQRGDAPAGVMDATYAEGRRGALHLKWRYQVRAGFAASAFHAMAGPRRAPSVLELGAADGLTLLELRARLGPEGRYDGVEYAAELLDEAPPLPENTTLLEGDVTALPEALEADSYDLCTALAVLEHLQDPMACLREARRMLRPGGVLVASCPHPIWDTLAGHLRLVADEHHEDALTAQRMKAMAEAAGFSEVVTRPFMWLPIATLPYLGLAPPPDWALRVDAAIRGLPFAHLSFVNQGLIARA